MPHPICPDCQRLMEGGFLLNGVPSAGATEAGQWVAGPPEKNFWGYLKLKGRRKLTVYAWRCPGCAQVRLYAPG